MLRVANWSYTKREMSNIEIEGALVFLNEKGGTNEELKDLQEGAFYCGGALHFDYEVEGSEELKELLGVESCVIDNLFLTKENGNILYIKVDNGTIIALD